MGSPFIDGKTESWRGKWLIRSYKPLSSIHPLWHQSHSEIGTTGAMENCLPLQQTQVEKEK